MDEIRNSVLRKIKPTKEEEEHIRDFINELMRISRTVSGLDCVVCGSLGKYTWLRGDHDIDLFIMFSQTVPRDELEKKGLEFGKRIVGEMKGRYIIKYAEHPYVHGKIKWGSVYFDIDIVPCYRIAKGEHIKSAVDRSPLHLEYVVTHMPADLRDDARMLKQFCKGVGIYGSDAKNLGFSGYICELLILKYGPFIDVLIDAKKWKIPQVIDLRDFARTDTRKKFPNQALVIIDPTDSNRNAAAVVSPENFIKFIKASKKFLEKPDESYFFPPEPKPLTKAETGILKKRETKFIALRMKKPDLIDDILYPQLRRAVKRIASLLRHNEFNVIRSYDIVLENEVILLFEMEIWYLPAAKKMVGPPIFSATHSQEFLSKYNKVDYGPFLEGVNWVVEKKREFQNASKLLKSFIGSSELELVKSGIPKYIANELNKSKILEHDEFWRFVEKERNASVFLKEKYFSVLS